MLLKFLFLLANGYMKINDNLASVLILNYIKNALINKPPALKDAFETEYSPKLRSILLNVYLTQHTIDAPSNPKDWR